MEPESAMTHPNPTPANPTAEVKRVTKVKKLVDIQLIAESSGMPSYVWRDDQDRLVWLERRAKDFNEFVRDHRSQDDIRLHVDRQYEDVCSGCGSTWEPYTIDDSGGVIACAGCGEPI